MNKDKHKFFTSNQLHHQKDRLLSLASGGHQNSVCIACKEITFVTFGASNRCPSGQSGILELLLDCLLNQNIFYVYAVLTA